MTIKIVYGHGWPYHHTASPLVEILIKKIANSFDQRFPEKNNIIIDSTWGNFPDITNSLKDLYLEIEKVDNVLLFSSVDPLPDGIHLPENNEFNLFEVGQIINPKFKKYQIDFHAIAVKKFFKKYTEEDLTLDKSNLVRFLCYQNKPHLHRQMLSHFLIRDNIDELGIVTLNSDDNGSPFIYPTLSVSSVNESIEEEYLQGKGYYKNNPYSLGETSIWKKCFLNVVSETFPPDSFDGWMFISEKTYKPILGMRPFIINGQGKILEYLENKGFFTFEEYWNGVDFRTYVSVEDTVEKVVKVIKQICSMSQAEIIDMYSNMLPKLIHNRQRFFEFANEEENKIEHMFLDN